MQNIEELARKVSNDAYAAVVKHFEEAEHAGLIVGNGHHMAQDIAEKAKNLLLERSRVPLAAGAVSDEGVQWRSSLIRFEGPDGDPAFIDPETVRGLHAASAFEGCTFIRTSRDREWGQTVKGTPDEVHARLFPPQPLSTPERGVECGLPK